MIALKVAYTPGLCCEGMIHMLTCWIAFSYTQTLPSCLNLWGSQSARRREEGEGREGGRGNGEREGGKEGCKKLRGEKEGGIYIRGG